MKKQLIVAGAFILSALSAQAQQPGLSDYYLATIEAAKQESLNGVWLTQSGNLEVEIAHCGLALCGKVSKVLDSPAVPPAEVTATATTAASTSILGKTILEGFTPSKTATWTGKIFNRANGETYSCQLRMTSPTELEVTPYKDKPEGARTQVWTRVSS